jgi:hypothetical protein
MKKFKYISLGVLILSSIVSAIVAVIYSALILASYSLPKSCTITQISNCNIAKLHDLVFLSPLALEPIFYLPVTLLLIVWGFFVLLPFYHNTICSLTSFHTEGIPRYRAFLIASLTGLPFLMICVELLTDVDLRFWTIPIVLSFVFSACHYSALKICKNKIDARILRNHFTAALHEKSYLLNDQYKKLFIGTGLITATIVSTIITLTLPCIKPCGSATSEALTIFTGVLSICLLSGVFLWLPVYWSITDQFKTLGMKRFLLYILLFVFSAISLVITTIITWLFFQSYMPIDTILPPIIFIPCAWITTIHFCIFMLALKQGDKDAITR